MIRAWVAAGFRDLEQFWRATPRDVAALIDGARMLAEREHDGRMEAAWVAGMLPRQEKPPRLRELMSKRRRPEKAADAADEYAAWAAWAAAPRG